MAVLLAVGVVVTGCGGSGPEPGALADSATAAKLRTAFALLQGWPATDVRMSMDAGATAHVCMNVKALKKPARMTLAMSKTTCAEQSGADSAVLYGDDRTVYRLSGSSCVATSHAVAPDLLRSWTRQQTYESKADDLIKAARTLTQDGNTVRADLDPAAALRMNGDDPAGAEKFTASMTATLSPDGSLRRMKIDVNTDSPDGEVAVEVEFAQPDTVDDQLALNHCTIKPGSPISSEDGLKQLLAS
ncbi:hypothetical protein L3Q65_21420 [Amycolatopsis sp. FU40]|uniref:hypothetical protein n=1 Tax=Amycolatopsis sp. FU40 TaxID=2914159 RepID=UPI001F1D680A|nr:hypothetical protein [Amycolatopsis sp. FU40]UKD59172.1 hypothetical protein L3Q65_21420 [Amycolatopsis sp. FU40]